MKVVHCDADIKNTIHMVTEYRLLWLIPIRNHWVGHVIDGGVLWYDIRTLQPTSRLVAEWLSRELVKYSASCDRKKAE